MAYDRKGQGGGPKWYEQREKKPGSRPGSQPGSRRGFGQEWAGAQGESTDRRARPGGFKRPGSPPISDDRPDARNRRGAPPRPGPGGAPERGGQDPRARYGRPGDRRPSRPDARQEERRDERRDNRKEERVWRPVRPGYGEGAADTRQETPRENLLAGRNPIREALKSGRDMEKLLVARGGLSGSAREIVSMARERRIVVQEVDRARLDALCPGHQGMAAFVSAFRYSTVEDMLALAKERGQPPFLVILDGITDPHNLGAIIRSAECAGAHGVIVPERRAVGLTPAAVKASAGAVEYLPVARVGNMPRLIGQLKGQGIWTYAAAPDGERYDRCDLSGPLALVVGAEGDGISRLTLENCDHRVALPLCGRIASLNASVAAGVLLYEVLRSRQLHQP